jgi:spore maturation protein SpmA
MPRKKLTKAQVKKKMNQIGGLMYDLMTDKMGHSDSFVPFGLAKLFELNEVMRKARARVFK